MESGFGFAIEIGIAALGLAFTTMAAALVLRAGSTRPVNRRLFWVLVCEATLLLSLTISNAGSILAGPEARPIFDNLWWVFIMWMLLIPWVYLRFLGVALDTPLTRPFRGAGAQSIILATPFVLVLLGWAELLIRPPSEEPYAPPVAGLVAISAVVLVPLYALVASFWAWRASEHGTMARNRARSFLLAFATRDIAIVLFWVFSTGIQAIYGDVDGDPAMAARMPPVVAFLNDISFALVIVSLVIYVPLLAYGVLKTQLFDIDLKVKAGVRKGTLTAVFVVAFFVAEQAGQALVSDQAGPFVGIVAAGLVALAIEPLRRFADRVANRAMPGVQDSDAYKAERKRQVYRAALEGAYEDGTVTPKERAVLTRLAAELGLDPREMVALEEAVASGPARNAGPPDERPARSGQSVNPK